jgi:hypothetical protein
MTPHPIATGRSRSKGQLLILTCRDCIGAVHVEPFEKEAEHEHE